MSHYDIGLVRAFVHLYETRSVTHAAERLFVTQPSVSYSLNKLRTLSQDQLFYRRGTRMQPTAAADALYPRLRDALRVMDDAMLGVPEFDPSSSRRTFTVMLTDAGASSLLPAILATAGAADGIAIQVEEFDPTLAHDGLMLGRVDAVICTPHIDVTGLRRDVLFADRYLGLCAVEHPRISDRPSVEEYLRERHVVAGASTGHDQIGLQIRKSGAADRIAATVPYLSVVADLLTDTELLGFAPARVAEAFTRVRTLRTFEVPFLVPPTEVALYSLDRDLDSPAHDWLRATILAALQDDGTD